MEGVERASEMGGMGFVGRCFPARPMRPFPFGGCGCLFLFGFRLSEVTYGGTCSVERNSPVIFDERTVHSTLETLQEEAPQRAMETDATGVLPSPFTTRSAPEHSEPPC